jgi:hypothetical protein
VIGTASAGTAHDIDTATSSAKAVRKVNWRISDRSSSKSVVTRKI